MLLKVTPQAVLPLAQNFICEKAHPESFGEDMFQFKNTAKNLLFTAPLFLLSAFWGCNSQPKNLVPAGVIGDQIRSTLQQAKQEKKKVLLNFYGDWCGACKLLHKKMEEPELQKYLQANFLILPINEKDDKDKVIQDYYRVRGFPNLILIDAQGQAVKSLPEQAVNDIFSSNGLQVELAEALKGASAIDQLLAAWKTVPEKERAKLAHKITETYIGQGNEAEMLKWLDVTVQSDKSIKKDYAAWTMFDVAMDFYEKRHEIEKMKFYYQKLLDDYPKYQDTPAAVQTLALQFWKEGKKAEAKQLFEKSLTVDPGNLHYMQAYIDFCAHYKWEMDRALELAAEALKNPLANKNDLHIPYSLLALELAKGHCKEAARLFGELSVQEEQKPSFKKSVERELVECKE